MQVICQVTQPGSVLTGSMEIDGGGLDFGVPKRFLDHMQRDTTFHQWCGISMSQAMQGQEGRDTGSLLGLFKYGRQ